MKLIAILIGFFWYFGEKTTFSNVKLFALPSQSSVSYEGFHPLHNWTAKSNSVVCVINYNPDKQEIMTVAASAKVVSFDSRNSNRDSNAMEKIEALLFPRVSFTGDSIVANAGKMTIVGNLSFHGVSKKISVNAQTSLKGNKMKVEGAFPVNLKEYNILIPSLLGTSIKEEINVKFTFVFDVNQ
ncbi:YceI family protein [Runella aurantiaca]|uniref:YceI family protein n=1 Tax=Runella aurantiaca TaxID=2282308 RepID=A0A369IKZ0_9BACT|nr:YceI family protein [Runella aurantiaca]RDB08023.1 YceI family protein [Runella aurantiaca]